MLSDHKSKERTDAELPNIELARLVGAEMTGWWSVVGDTLSDICRYALLPPGKLFRPILLMESGIAVGGALSHFVPAAVGAEFGHVASLIHDDIIDEDEMRRGRPSVYAQYGRDNAIISGDALFLGLFKCLAECHANGAPAERVVRALDVVSSAGIELCRGQVLESETTGDLESGIDTYFQVIRMKTAALFRGSCMCGAILGGGSDRQVEDLGRYGENLGIAFQIKDDLLPYTSDASVTGKSALSDVRNRRVTLPVILARDSAGPEARHYIDQVFTKQSPDVDDLQQLQDIVRTTGAVDDVLQVARDHVALALTSLSAVPDSTSRQHLARFAELTLARSA